MGYPMALSNSYLIFQLFTFLTQLIPPNLGDKSCDEVEVLPHP